jgi:hypothetical protein
MGMVVYVVGRQDSLPQLAHRTASARNSLRGRLVAHTLEPFIQVLVRREHLRMRFYKGVRVNGWHVSMTLFASGPHARLGIRQAGLFSENFFDPR